MIDRVSLCADALRASPLAVVLALVILTMTANGACAQSTDPASQAQPTYPASQIPPPEPTVEPHSPVTDAYPAPSPTTETVPPPSIQSQSPATETPSPVPVVNSSPPSAGEDFGQPLRSNTPPVSEPPAVKIVPAVLAETPAANDPVAAVLPPPIAVEGGNVFPAILAVILAVLAAGFGVRYWFWPRSRVKCEIERGETRLASVDARLITLPEVTIHIALEPGEATAPHPFMIMPKERQDA